MRTSEEFRASTIELLNSACRRPSMYGGRDSCVQIVLRGIIGDLCFIDERETNLEEFDNKVRSHGLFRSTGIRGGFDHYIQGVDDFASEVASIFAELADRLGYLDVDRRLSAREWREMKKGLRTEVRRRDWAVEQLLDAFGAPSLQIQRVYCYASEIGIPWIFFDFARLTEMNWSPDNMILRNARIPAAHFANELAFTPFGSKFKRARKRTLKEEEYLRRLATWTKDRRTFRTHDGTVEIREAVAGDWEQIWPIFRAVVTKGDAFAYWPDIPEIEARGHWMALSHFVFVAVEGSRVVGSYWLRPNQPGLGSHIANAAYIVDPECSGRGIGRAMGDHSLRAAKALGYRALQFNIVVSTNLAAVRLWKSLGFEIIGTIPNAFRHASLGFVDAHIMYRSLEDITE